MTCYNCRGEVHEDEARTIGQVIVVCTPCHHKLESMILNGYFDRPDQLDDEMIFESQVQVHINRWA